MTEPTPETLDQKLEDMNLFDPTMKKKGTKKKKTKTKGKSP